MDLAVVKIQNSWLVNLPPPPPTNRGLIWPSQGKPNRGGVGPGRLTVAISPTEVGPVDEPCDLGQTSQGWDIHPVTLMQLDDDDDVFFFFVFSVIHPKKQKIQRSFFFWFGFLLDVGWCLSYASCDCCVFSIMIICYLFSKYRIH